MPATEQSTSESIVQMMGAVSHALKATAEKASASGGKLKKPEVVAALLKVLHTVVASQAGAPSKEKTAEVSKAISGTFDDDLEAIKAFVDDKANGLQ